MADMWLMRDLYVLGIKQMSVEAAPSIPPFHATFFAVRFVPRCDALLNMEAAHLLLKMPSHLMLPLGHLPPGWLNETEVLEAAAESGVKKDPLDLMNSVYATVLTSVVEMLGVNDV